MSETGWHSTSIEDLPRHALKIGGEKTTMKRWRRVGETAPGGGDGKLAG